MSAALHRSLTLAARAWHEISEGAGFDRTIESVCRDASAEETAAVRSILYGAIRRALFVERLIGILASRKPSVEIASLLAVALSELTASEEKAYAVVNEAIKAARANSKTATAAGFINACLRRYQREKDALQKRLLSDREVRFNAPRWWIERIEKEFGKEKAAGVFAVSQLRPPLTLRVNVRKTTPQLWCNRARAAGLEVKPLGNTAVLLITPRPVSQIPGFADGEVSVQDAGAQLAALFLAPKNGERILDACAAPGGKTAHLLETADCKVTALEVDPKRADKINENLRRLGLSADTAVKDAADVASWWDGKPFDAVLLDAPCTASGIVRRHPEIVFTRRPADIVALAQQQKRLLEALWPVIKPGGRMLYCVCSVFDTEGQKQIDAFLSTHSDAKLGELAEGLGAQLRLCPCDNPDILGRIDGPHDGFFYALLYKI